MNSVTLNQMNLKYIIVACISVFLTFFFHEAAHLLMGELLGYDMTMNLNSANLKKGQSYSAEWHRQMVSIAGPVFTIIQALVFFVIINKTKRILLYPFLFGAALMRGMAAVISAVNLANDEARVSEWLGIGKMTLPILVSLLLISLCVKTTKINKISWQFNLVTFLVISFGMATLVYLNQYFLT